MTYLGVAKLLPLLDLGSLLLEVLGLGEHTALLGVVGVGCISGLLLRELGSVVGWSEFERATTSTSDATHK